MDRDEAFAVPFSWLRANKDNLNRTDSGERFYWHIAITTLDDGELAINSSRIGLKTPLAPFRFAMTKSDALESGSPLANF
jgi:hypothetical protein